MISMRYARNFARGDGLNWNRGEATVEGYTNLAWTLWMSAIHKLGLGDATVSLPIMLSGMVLVGIAAWCSYKIAARLSDVPWVAPVSAAATLCCYSLNFWSLRGMEVGAVAACASGLTYLALCHGPRLRPSISLALGLLGAATVMLRSDAVLMLGLAALYAAWRSGKRYGLWVFLAIMAPAVVAVRMQLAFRRGYYGESLPNTYYLKLAHISALARIKRGLFVALQFVGYHAPIPLAVLGASAWALGARGLRALGARHELSFLAVLILTQAAYAIYVGGDAWEFMLYANRYWSAVMPLFAVLVFTLLGEVATSEQSPETMLRHLRPALMLSAAAGLLAMLWAALAPETGIAHTIQLSQKVLGMSVFLFVSALCAPLVAPALDPLRIHIARALSDSTGPFSARFATLTLLVVWGLGQAEPLATWAKRNAAQYTDEEQYARLGLQLRDHTPADFRIAVMAAGATPYFSDRPTEDLLGKSDSHVAHLPPKGVFSPGHDKWDYAFSIGRKRPDLIVELSDLTPSDVEDIRGWGYSLLPSGMWLHQPSRVSGSIFAKEALP